MPRSAVNREARSKKGGAILASTQDYYRKLAAQLDLECRNMERCKPGPCYNAGQPRVRILRLRSALAVAIVLKATRALTQSARQALSLLRHVIVIVGTAWYRQCIASSRAGLVLPCAYAGS